MNGIEWCRNTKEKRALCPGAAMEKAKADVDPHDDKVERDPMKKSPSSVCVSYIHIWKWRVREEE